MNLTAAPRATENQLHNILISIRLMERFSNFKLFTTCKCIRTNNNKFVNACAACAFGVYLFHEHCLIKSKLWQFIGEMVRDAKLANYTVKALVSICGIYIICTLLTWIWNNRHKRFSGRLHEERLACALSIARKSPAFILYQEARLGALSLI